MNLFTMYVGAGRYPHESYPREVAEALRANGAGFFGACTVQLAVGAWEDVHEPCAILTAYTDKARADCERWAAAVSLKYGETCVACEWRPAPGFALVYAFEAPYGKAAGTWECPACGADHPARDIARPCAECGAKAAA